MKRSVFILMLFIAGRTLKARPEALPTSLPVVHRDALYVKVKHHPAVHSTSTYHFNSGRKFITTPDSVINSDPVSTEFILPEYRYLNKGLRRNLHNRKRSTRPKLPLSDQPQNTIRVPP